MVLRTIVSVYEQDWPADCLGRRRQRRRPRSRARGGGLSAAGPLPLAAAALLAWPRRRREGGQSQLRAVDARPRASRAPVHRDARRRRRTAVHGIFAAGDRAARRRRRLAFVQTIKEAQVSARRSVQQPGVDLLPRPDALAERGERRLPLRVRCRLAPERAATRSATFPTWNLVEDLQSGVEALRRGWRGLYLPIVGAVPQHSPEDVPSVYKQRGTWAVDTRSIDDLERSARTQPAPARAVHRTLVLLPQRASRCSSTSPASPARCSGG